ncbi:MAG TPA: Ig-like domain-containing protein, partial [Pirellulaceae bacterium]|nr:Ig-like domain-containing protein [Pirellulaceae bacterium]
MRLLAIVAMVLGAAAPCLAQGIQIWPSEVKLAGPFARQQVLISQEGNDVTHEATFASSDPSIVAIRDHGYLVPLGDGEATITVMHDGMSSAAKVTVSGFAQPQTVDFQGEIVPLLSRYGCNSGGCHGKASGQNGFKLSLFGFDVAW